MPSWLFLILYDSTWHGLQNLLRIKLLSDGFLCLVVYPTRGKDCFLTVPEIDIMIRGYLIRFTEYGKDNRK